LVLSSASIFCDFGRFGEERLRGVEGEETRGKEKKRQLKISENQQVGPKKGIQKAIAR
jgi:hypothetical protein